MRWLNLTQVNTGAKIQVNMEHIILIAPNKTGGSALVSDVLEKESARVIPVQESPAKIAEMLKSPA